MNPPSVNAAPGRAAYVLLGLALLASAFVVFVGALNLVFSQWGIALLALPHGAGLAVAAMGLRSLPDARRRTGVAALATSAGIVGWSLVLGMLVWRPVLLFWIGPVALIAAGVVLVRRNPKGQESPLPSLPPSDARRP